MHQYVAVFLKAAIQKIFPKIECFSTQVDRHGFMVEFPYFETFQETHLSLLESKMKELYQKEAQVKEMLATNAKEFLQYRNHQKLAESLVGVKGTVFLMEIDDYIDLSITPYNPCFHFALLRFEQKKNCISIFGVGFANDKEKKQFLKNFRKYPKKSHEYLAKKWDLYESEMWHPRGMILRNTLTNLWREVLIKEGFEEVETRDPIQYFTKTNKAKFSYWKNQCDVNYFFCDNSVFSFLQFIQNWIKIFNFELAWVLVLSRHKKRQKTLKQALEACNIDYRIDGSEEESSRIELRIADAMGRYWTGPFLQLEKEGGFFSLFGDLKRFIALLLEKYEKGLPFWLCPEQVRVLAFEGVNPGPIIEIFNRHKIRYSVDAAPNLLKEKMYRALRMKVPYVMVFGKREETSKKMNVKAYDTHLEMTMNLEEIEQFLVERKFESQ